MLSNRFPPNVVGGAEILAGDVANALRERGHDISVLTSRDPGEASSGETLVQSGTSRVVHGLSPVDGSSGRGAARLSAYYRQSHSRSSARTVHSVIRESAPDVVYVWNLSIGIVSILRVLRQVPFPIVFHLHSYWWQYINSPLTSFSTLRIAWIKKLVIGPVPPLPFTTLIATSDSVKTEYTRAGCPEDRIEVIDNAVGSRFLDGRQAPVRSAATALLVYAGRLTAAKGVLVALQALHLLVDRDTRAVRLEIYGAGDQQYEKRLRSFVREHRLEDAVSFCGLVGQDRLIDAYDAADVVLVPSLWEEPFGLVAVEAMARGAAVIASDVGGLRGIVRDGIDGRLVAPGDAPALAAAIATWLDHPEARRRAGLAGQRVVRERFTLDVCSARVERHLAAALTLDRWESRWAG